MELISFALLREGTSDDGLIPRLQELLVEAGAESAVGTSRRYKGSPAHLLRLVQAEEGAVDLIFLHMDADSRDATPRRDLVLTAASEVELAAPRCSGGTYPRG